MKERLEGLICQLPIGQDELRKIKSPEWIGTFIFFQKKQVDYFFLFAAFFLEDFLAAFLAVFFLAAFFAVAMF